MICPTLHELPPPGKDTQGWPWTEATPHVSEESDVTWPKISVITPSYNQAEYLEETIRSVLLQGYPNLEYIIMDGGSSDGSVEIIKKYQSWITHWTSEADQGQTDAIQRGFDIATGSLFAWLNSDDIYLPSTLIRIAELHLSSPQHILLGDVLNFSTGKKREVLSKTSQQEISLRNLLLPGRSRYTWHQPGLFFPRLAYQQVGGLDSTLHYGMDHDLMCRFLIEKLPLITVNQTLAGFRVHPHSKTSTQNTNLAIENYRIRMRYWDHLPEKRWELILRLRIHLLLRAMKLFLQGNLRDSWLSIQYALWKSIAEKGSKI